MVHSFQRGPRPSSPASLCLRGGDCEALLKPCPGPQHGVHSTAKQGPAKAAPEVSTSLCLPKCLTQEGTPIHYPADEGSIQGQLCPLDSNLSHFILVEPGALGSGDGLAELRLSLEKHISQQRTGYGGKAMGVKQHLGDVDMEIR